MSSYMFLLALLSSFSSLNSCKPFRLGCITPNLRHLKFTHLSVFGYHLSFSYLHLLSLRSLYSQWREISFPESEAPSCEARIQDSRSELPSAGISSSPRTLQ